MIFEWLAGAYAVKQVAALLAMAEVRDDAAFFFVLEAVAPEVAQGFLVEVLISLHDLPADAPEQEAH